MTISPAIAAFIKVSAPTLAAALSGPFAPLAAGIVTAALRQWLPDEAKAAAAANPNAKAAPEQILAAVAGGMDDPKLVYDLQQAEAALKMEEKRLPFRFAELEVKDREGARKFARETGSAGRVYKLGWTILAVDALVTAVALVGGFLLLTGVVTITDQNIVLAVFTLVGAIVGRISARADTFVNFVFGSSEGSKQKGDQLGAAVEDLGGALADAAQKNRPAPAPLPTPPVVVVPQPLPPPVPHPPTDSGEWKQGPFGGVRWRTTAQGVVLEGKAEPARTVGQPTTVKRIWRDFGPMILEACARDGVPLELVVACIATESRGVVNATLVEPDKRMSVGLMQLLTGTASEIAGKEITPAALMDPANNIGFGTRYIKSQYKKTKFEPPLVSAAYNAGGLYKAREQDDNPWNLRSTGNHIERFVLYYNDSVAVAAEDGWALAPSSSKTN